MRVCATLFLCLFCLVSTAFAAVDVPADLSGKAFEQWQEKEQRLAEALNRVNSVKSSMQNYLRWAKDDPSAAKKPGSISDMGSSLQSIRKAAEASAKTGLAVPAVDEAFNAVAEKAGELQSVNAEAYKYYNRKDHLADDMARGKELHPRLVAAYEAFIASVDALVPLKQELTDKLEPVQLAAIEKKYGKKYYWQHTNLMAKARSVIKLLPDSAGEKIDRAAFEAAVNSFADALAAFETYYEETGEEAVRKESMMGLNPNSFNNFLAACRELGQELEKNGKPDNNYVRRINGVVTSYNNLVNSSNRTRFKLPR